MKWLIMLLALSAALLLPALAQQSAVQAEAIQQANLRAEPDVNAALVGQIAAGTRYPVIGRSELFPWVLLADPASGQPIGWVFIDLLTLYGDVNSVPLSALDVSAPPTATPTAAASPTASLTPDPNNPVTPTPAPSATAAFSVAAIAQGEINIRYFPGVEAPRLGVARAGDRFAVLGYHTQFPWIMIAYDAAPEGLAWVALDVVALEGDLYSTRPILTTTFNLPTLTPTPAVIGQSSVVRDGVPVPLSPAFAALGSQLWALVLNAGFDPSTSRFGALYLRDLETGEELVFGGDVAFSGTSINKIAILVDLFGVLTLPPDAQTAQDIANTMICSENVATNRLLSVIGGGIDYTGADGVTDFLTQIGLRRTFLTAPYLIPGATPAPPPQPIRYPVTDADQTKASPNVTNQMTVDEMGYLLTGLYDCAYNDSGFLMEGTFAGRYTGQECRRMLYVMSNNTVDALLKAGVPEGVTVAHKHGWVEDTHGNAAVIFSPERDYVMVMMLHQPTWLNFQDSLPVIAEASRVVYNHYNPNAPLAAIREGYIPTTEECSYNAGSPVVQNLMLPTFAQDATTPPGG